MIHKSSLLAATIVGAFLTACAPPPPANEMERLARLAAAAELAAQRCPGQLGGYQGAVQARQDANRTIATARQLGATDAVIAKARSETRQAFDATVVWTDPNTACNQLVGSIAWASS